MSRQRQGLWSGLVVLLVTLALAATTALARADEEPPSHPPPGWAATSPPAASSASSSESAASVTAALPCSACHTTAGWRAKEGEAAQGEGTTKFDHSKTGFPLTGQHAKTPCVGCHDGRRTVKRLCSSCHADAHRARLSESCDRCHTPVGWRNTRALDMHRLTRLPLTGMHVLLDCTQCHRRASEHQWTGAPADCFACHEKDYRRTDLRPVHNGSVAGQPPFPRDCSLCHRSIAWAPAKFSANLITGNAALPLTAAPSGPAAGPVAPVGHDVKFPLRFGVHRTAACADCHTSPAVPRLVRCTGCHAHETVRLTAQHKGGVSPFGAACLSCHPAGMRR